MKKVLRDHLAVIENEGLAVVGVDYGKHCRIKVQHNGVERFLVCAISPSDSRRGLIQFRSDVRKVKRDMEATR